MASRVVESELDFGCHLGPLFRLERFFTLQMQHQRVCKGVREGADAGVEHLNRAVIALTGDIDAVFGSFQLFLQIEEILIGLQVGIFFDNHHQPRQCAG